MCPANRDKAIARPKIRFLPNRCFGDVASQNLFLQAAALDEREAGGCLGVDDAGERTAVLSFDLVIDKARFDRGVRIENGEQKILWAFGAKRGQIRPHGMSLSAQGVAARAIRCKNRLAPARISGQIRHALVFGQHLGAAAGLSPCQESVGPSRNHFVLVFHQTLTIRQRKFTGRNRSLFHCVEQADNPFVARQQGAEDGITQRRRMARPVGQE